MWQYKYKKVYISRMVGAGGRGGHHAGMVIGEGLVVLRG